MSKELGMTTKKKNFSKWYLEVVKKAEIVDTRYPLQGAHVWMPYGFKALKLMFKIVEEELDNYGHEETYFPTLIPGSIFSKEKNFLRGFKGECFKITKAGEKKLEEELILRPTSETVMYEIFHLWIRSWRDLPLKIYQTVNIFRYETKMTKPLLRVREIVKFKEAHTVHKTAEEADKQVEEGIKIYKNFYDKLCLPYIILKTPKWDTFAGAEYNYDFFIIMPDKNVLELASVINLGQKFAKSFDIKFEDQDGRKKYPYQTCYGISERSLGALISMFGDDSGLILPMSIAPIQIIIIPIGNEKKVMDKCKELEKILKHKFRVKIDDSAKRPGFKFNYWELKGVPIRIEIGLKELKEKKLTIFRRDKNEKEKISNKNLIKYIHSLEKDINKNLSRIGKQWMKENIYSTNTLKDAKNTYKKNRGIIKVPWCNNEKCAKKIEDTLAVSSLGTNPGEKCEEKCVACGKKSKTYLYLGKVPY